MDTKITGKDLYVKFQELMPGGMLKKITPEILNDTCYHPSTTPFLQWFCDNVGPDNILSHDEIQLRENLKESNHWVTGNALKESIANALILKDNQELIQFIELNRNYEADLFKIYKVEKEAYDEDFSDLQTLESKLSLLKELDVKLAEELENEEALLEKAEIQESKSYQDCSEEIERTDAIHRELNDTLENIVKIYSSAVQKKSSSPVTWTELPLDMFISQTEMCYKYLLHHVQREYTNTITDVYSESSNNSKIILSLNGDDRNNHVETRSENEQIQELMQCQRDIISSTLDKVVAEIEKKGIKVLLDKLINIYNSGNTKYPQFDTQMHIDISQLLSERSLLNDQNTILESQLKQNVEIFGQSTIKKILLEQGRAGLAKKEKRLKLFENFLHFARDIGHSTADLLTMLMQYELQNLQKIIKLFTLVRSHLQVEYTLSSKRTDIMKNFQAEFNAVMSMSSSSSTCDQNVYNKIFTELMMINDTSNAVASSDAFGLSLIKYESITLENEKLRDEIMQLNLDNVIEKLKIMKIRLMDTFNEELSNGVTKSFKHTPDDLATQFELILKKIDNVQLRFNDARKKCKYFSDKINKDSLEREKQILWQKFLVNPENLKTRYDELQSIVDRLHFVNSLQNQ